MKRSWRITLIVLLALPLGGALAGRLAAPSLARMDEVVWLAGEVWKDEGHGTRGQADPDALKWFQNLGLPAGQLYLQAAETRHKLAVGATWFGLWCGLVAALKILTQFAWRRRREYDADPAHCLACARCYLSCPVERERLELESKEQPL